MGNLSNPSINRWGLNLFWYNYWFADKNKSFEIHQDNLINKLMYIYLNYGIFKKNSKYSFRFWTFSNLKSINSYLIEDRERVLQYLRFSQYKNKLTQETKIISFRIKRKDLHFTKFWILRFNKWLIINIYALQPLKKKSNIGKFFKKSKYAKASAIPRKSKKNIFRKHLVRQFLIFNFFKNQDLILKNAYLF